MHRFFLPAHAFQGDQIVLPDETTHQVCKVLRMAAGARIVVLDNSGWEYEVLLTAVTRHGVTGEIVEQRPSAGEPPVHVTLYQALMKRDKFEWVLQKGTEVGVSRFVPLVTERSVVQETAVKPNKLARWQKIITEAAEQSRRGRIPELWPPVKLNHVAQQLDGYDLTLIAWEEAKGMTLKATLARQERPSSIALFIGPEGGFTADEAMSDRLLPFTLGPRILRAETAAVVATALVLYECE